MPIYKDGGCSKIVCPKCKHVLCYECMEEWEFKHYGCSEYGWLSPIFYFFQERCCSANHIDKLSEVEISNRMRALP
jgi:hypothetical protein